MPKQAVIYTRFSPRPNAKDCDSCEKQAERCVAYCNQKDYGPCFAVFDEKNVSGGTLNRPRLQAAIESLNRGDVLVVDSSDRLARDMLVNLTIRHQVEQAGATIEYANGSPSEDTPEGRLFQNMLAAFAAYERDRIRERTKQGLDRKRKNGERISGQIPIGWRLDPEDPTRLLPCEQEKQAIELACRLSSVHDMPSATIAKTLDLEIGPCRGKPWSARTIRKMIAKHFFWADPQDGKPELEPQHP